MVLSSSKLRKELLDQLLNLNYHAYCQTIGKVLKGMFFHDIELTGRVEYVGRNTSGGVDILAYRSVPGGRRLVAIQVKQFTENQPVYQRSLDELRGAVLRLGAAEGMLITSGCFSPSVRRAQLASAPVAPIRCMDGAELLDQMASTRVGVKKLPGLYETDESPYILDRRYFDSMNAEYRGNARAIGDERRTVYIVVGGRARKRLATADATVTKYRS